MILLTDVATKLQKILNGTDSEISETNRPNYKFVVATQGFHLDYIYDKNTKGNFIPVFIGSMGGEINAIPDLLEVDAEIPVSIYFPVRFKNDFFAANEYIAKCFVGKYLTYGSGSTAYKCVSNISVARYGEIENLDLKEFKNWVSNVYQEEIDVMEAYMSMEFTLYLSNVSNDFYYGNEATITLTRNNVSVTPVFAEASIQSNSEPAAQQLLGATIPESDGLPVNTAYGSSFAIYLKKDNDETNDFYTDLLTDWFDGKSQALEFTFTLTLGDFEYERTCYVQSVNLIVEKGEPITITFTFNKKVS